MSEIVYVPVILDVFLTPNPAEAGKPVFISVAVEDVATEPREAVWPCGVFPSGAV